MTDGRALLEAHLNGEPLSEAQREALSAWVCASPDNAKLAAELTHLSETIAQNIKAQSFGSLMDACDTDLLQDDFEEEQQDERDDEAYLPPIHIDATALTKEKYVSALSYVIEHTFTRKRITMLAAAATVLLGAVLAIILMVGPKPVANVAHSPDEPIIETKPIVATLTAEHDAIWDRRPGQDLYADQRLTLTAGFAEITTRRGTIAILEAPCVVELMDNDNALRLHAGKLVGLCHTDSSKGFLVKTEHAKITDLGTEFGVTATSSGTETSVFVGEVAVKTEGAPTTVITHNQTARISLVQGKPTMVVEKRTAKGYVQRMPLSDLILSASSNLPGFEIEVVPDGAAEDAKLYTDRDYQLNGVDANGLPAELLGGDLIRTPSSARPLLTPGTEDFSIQIDLAQDVDVYILYTSSQKTPDWLEADYTKTLMVVGMDASNRYSKTFSSAKLGVGPGVEIDQIYDVWKRNQPATGTVITGPYERTESGMYGIIIQPHQANSNPLTSP
jgi:hypothetical protein